MSTRMLRTLTALLVGAIAALAFLVSFEAISAYAVQVGAFSPGLRWAAPLLVDTFTVAATLVILARSRDGVRAVYAWTLVGLASAVSVSLNIAHAPAHLSSRLVAALPPAALLAALELVMSEARRLRARAASAQGSGEPQGGAPVDRTRPAHSGELQAAGERTSRQIVRELLAGEQDVTVQQVREATGVGRRRAYELLAQVRAEGNGQGRRDGAARRTSGGRRSAGFVWAGGRRNQGRPARAGLASRTVGTGLPASLPAGAPAPRWPGRCGRRAGGTWVRPAASRPSSLRSWLRQP